MNKKMNVQHRTSNIERPIKKFEQLSQHHILCSLCAQYSNTPVLQFFF